MIVGSIVAIVTPMDKSGAIDWAALERLVDFHIENGTNSIVAVGTTGESATLPVDEHLEVLHQVIARANGRIPIIAGSGANSTAEALELTEMAKSANADACLIVTPYYNKPTQEGLYQHYKLLADSVDIPQILYNVPGRTGCDMLPETIERLASHPNIVGHKEATGDLDRARDLFDRCGDQIAVYSGDDATAAEFILAGGKGNISVTANVAPRLMSDMCAAALQGDAEKARALNAKLEGLNQELFVESNPIPVKWALKEMGLIQEGQRLPLTPLDSQYHDVVRQALRQAGVL
jgi:4-hydroxy-tetrahydrodipicolinate synthase